MIKLETFYSDIMQCQVWRVWFDHVGWVYDSETSALEAMKRGCP